jgi:hypothetical protein
VILAGSAVVVDVYTTASPANPTGFATSPVSVCARGASTDMLRAQTESMRLPFHMWDYIVAFRSWDIFSVDNSKISAYNPFRSDVSVGDALRKVCSI